MEAKADEATVLELNWGESGTAHGLKVTFTGGSTVNYGSGRPPAGSIILLLEHEGQEESVAWLDNDWGDPHQAFGFTYRVLNPPELKPRHVRVEVKRAS